MDLEETLDKEICVLCHEFPMGTGAICDNCRYDKKRVDDIVEKKLRRIEAEKIEQLYEDFKNDNCIKCHTNSPLETVPYCVDCYHQVSLDGAGNESLK